MSPSTRYQVTPGYIVIDTSTCRGGVTYHRDRTDEREWRVDGIEREIHSTKQIDHVAIVKEGQQLVSAARYVLRKRCAQTAIGYFIEADHLDALATELAEYEKAARDFNARARAHQSSCRVSVGCVPVRLEIDNVAAAQAIAKTIRDTLGQLIRALRTGDDSKVAPVALRAKNLDQLACGMQRDSIVFAWECVQAARKQIREAKRDGRDPLAVGRGLDLTDIDAAIGVFTEVTVSGAPSLSLVG